MSCEKPDRDPGTPWLFVVILALLAFIALATAQAAQAASPEPTIGPRDEPERATGITIDCSQDYMAVVTWIGVKNTYLQFVAWVDGEQVYVFEGRSAARTTFPVQNGQTVEAAMYYQDGLETKPASQAASKTCSWEEPEPEEVSETSTTTTTEPVHEDEPGWDCETMGNRECGTTTTVAPTPSTLPYTGLPNYSWSIISGSALLILGTLALIASRKEEQ